MLLLSLHHFASPGYMTDIMESFGRDESTWCRAFHWFIDYMIDNFKYLVTDMLGFWSQHFQVFSVAMRDKLYYNTGIYYGEFRVCAMIDCTVIASLRSGD